MKGDETESLSIPQTGLHPLFGGRLSSLLRVLSRYGKNFCANQYPRLGAATLINLLGTPLRWRERWKHDKQLREMPPPEPVFIIGHWRSGTTNLHNHFLQDDRFGCVTLLHCLTSPSFLTFGKTMRKIVQHHLPKQRPMDSVPVGLDAPMSEDFAMACLTELSHYHRYFFPQSNNAIVRRTILFEGVSEKQIRSWYRDYDLLLRKAAMASGCRNLVLKNPPNTARIRLLLRQYPNARFIHVIRNPYDVILSTLRMMEKFLRRFSFQSYSAADLERNVLTDYALVMRQFLEDRHLIPQHNLVEIRHEDFVADSVRTLRRVYRQLRLPGFTDVSPKLDAYAAAIAGYRNNDYRISDSLHARIATACDFALDRWGFRGPLDRPASESA